MLGQNAALRSDAASAQTLEEQRQKATDARTFEATGYAMLGLGSALAVTGAVLTGVAASRRRTVAAVVMPSGSSIAVAFGGAF
jgi:hypothetical protein